MHDPMPDSGLVADGAGPPPPVRRLVPGEQPTVALPPLPGTIRAAERTAARRDGADACAGASTRCRADRVVERMRTDDLRDRLRRQGGREGRLAPGPPGRGARR